VSIAAYASKAGLPCEVFVAATTPRDKIEHIDAPVHLVDGTREDVAAAAVAHVEASGAFYASHVWNPWFFEGTKHYVNELIVQLGGHLPAALLLPVGNGTLVLGAWRAMQERAVMTPIVAVQAELCAPIAAAFARGDEAAAHVVNRGTVAAGVAIAAPVRGAEILTAIRNTAGSVVTVTDAEIMAAASELAGQGYDVEPTAAVPAAALPQLGPARAGWADVVVPVAAAGTGGR
jgi:threonine synthase